jgi:Carboxypeptidase regulatory-like domain/TonB-dependent Receptor Plug Domain
MKWMRTALRTSGTEKGTASPWPSMRQLWPKATSLANRSHFSLALATAVFVMCSMLHSSLASCQSTSASLTGLVDDPNKALITDASITAINTETGVKTSTKTNTAGQYVLPNLTPGKYRIEVDKPSGQLSVNKSHWSVSTELALAFLALLLAAWTRREQLVCRVRLVVGSRILHSLITPLRQPLFSAFLLLVVIATFAPLTSAQSTSASLTGLVDDPNKALIPNAQVTAINTETGVRTGTTTNTAGQYVIPNLTPGKYRIEVDKQGFKGIIEAGLTLHVQDVVQMNFHMAVGSASETVSVNADEININKSDGAVSTVVDSEMVKNMPLNGRSFQDLILLTPGIVTQSPQSGATLGQNGEFSVNGQRTESNYYIVDGVSANIGASQGTGMTGPGAGGSLAASTALGTTQALVSVDDLQEFRVQSSTYSAEYGRSPGAQLAFETKSGNNQLHGTVSDYLRNDYFDANDWFNDYYSTPKTATRQNDFGGTLGGPVEIPGFYNGKDKTFFFVTYEGLRLASPQPATATDVPDLCMRGLGPCPTSGPGAGRMPAAGGLLPVVKAFPLPSSNGVEDAINGFNQFIGTWSNPSSLDSTSVRLDHAINDRLRLFFRFSSTSSDSTTRGANSAPATLETPNNFSIRSYTIGANSIFSNHSTNEFRFNQSSNSATSHDAISPIGGSAPVNLNQLTGLESGSSAVAFIYGGQFLALDQSPEIGSQNQWNFVDSLTYSLGRHQLKFGLDYRRLTPTAIPDSPFVTYDYFTESAVETNGASVLATADGFAYPLYVNLSAFAQDEWKISQRLNLSLGLRWELDPPPSVTQGSLPYTVQGDSPNSWTLAPQGTPLWHTTWFNFGPRLGAAYILRNALGWQTVVRGGGGVFFDTGQQLGSEGFNGPGFVSYGGFQPGRFPVLPAVPSQSSLNPPPSDFEFAYFFASHLQLPYTLQWNAAIEQALGRSQALTISYVASHASRLLKEDEVLPPSNPNAFVFFLFENGSTSDYNSLQFEFRRTLSRGLTALASYTWSHCLDEGSVNFSNGYQRGNCDFDVRHNLSGAISYDLPNWNRSVLMESLLNHWGFDDRLVIRTAFPVQLNGSPVFDPVTGNQTSTGLDLVSGQPVYLYGTKCSSVYNEIAKAAGNPGSTNACPGGRGIDPCAFALPTGPQPYAPCPVGNAGSLVGRNLARGFGAWQMDLALRREFPIHENLKLQFRAEAFNVFNHPDFGSIDTGFGDLTFGQAKQTLHNSLGVLNSLYQAGGPRSMQFALKAVF